MYLRRHRCIARKISPAHPLAGRTLYVPSMAEGSAEALAAAFRWLGVEARCTPPSDARTMELGAKYTGGDECYPAKVTFGDFAKITEQPGFDPAHTAFFMASGSGPCRFGQYAQALRKVVRDAGLGNIQVFSSQGERGYSDLGGLDNGFLRTAWRGLVAADILRRRLLQTRPYETVRGAADAAFRESVKDFCETLEHACSDADCQLQELRASLARSHERFQAVPAHYHTSKPLIGVIGEIYCRLNNFSNQNLVRKLEEHGAECWLSDVTEWIGYSNSEEVRNLRLQGRVFSFSMIRSKLRSHVQHTDERALLSPFFEDFAGYEEPSTREILDLAGPYLPFPGAEGEMVVSMGKGSYLAKHGVDGIVDISPFTCMNGIVSEAIYPRLSRDHGGIPIRNFYFDGTQSDLDRDIGIYLELARSYRPQKLWPRHFPARFGQFAA